MPTVECIHLILIHASNRSVWLSPWFLHVLSIVPMLLPGQLNTKDPGAPQTTPTNSLRRTGTILSKASALSQFSSYGEFVLISAPLLGGN